MFVKSTLLRLGNVQMIFNTLMVSIFRTTDSTEFLLILNNYHPRMIADDATNSFGLTFLSQKSPVSDLLASIVR